MADGAECSAVNPAKKKQLAGKKSRQSQQKKTSSSRVNLEKVLGITTTSSSGLTSDPNSGLIAYPAGCVIVLLHPKKNKQSHIINTSRKPFSALAFSHDGKYLVTGESGHMPCVRVWEVGGGQVAEVQSHKYGVSCVAFSTSSCYIVSVGFQHDMTVSVWDWRKGSIIASNKVSSRVFAVSFSQDNSYFVTAGNRHIKFWYLDASKERRVNSTVPLIGRSGLLGDHRNNVFSGVACGCGLNLSNTYCITSSGLLCLFNSNRQLEAWVNLKTSSASCLAISEDFIFCGCADGLIRVFRPSNLQYITSLHRPHRLGVDLTQSVQHGLIPASPGAQYPDTVALTFDPTAKHLTCVYNDHSLYVWNVKDVRNVGKLYSALYHSSCVWSVEVYPELLDMSQACLPPSSFLTCSSDNTIRLWHTEPPTRHRNLYSNDLLKILYVGENTQCLQADAERGEAAGADSKAGIRVLGISHDGQHLAAGDRSGNLRIFGLEFLDELVKIEAHDSEVLCLEFSPKSTGVNLLASASRDRLIHIFNVEKNYSLEQTLNDHSASITAVKFTGESPEVRMVSCGADKSIYFQTAEQMEDALSFSRSHHVVEKTTLYDMDLDSSRTHVAIACQDRNVRVYNVETGKQKKCLKGSSSDEGALLKVQMDLSGSYLATSCSDKNITISDYESGEFIATLFGHSEIVTCMRFSQDCRHLISVSGDSCVFLWRLDPQMTATMRKRRSLRLKSAPETYSRKHANIRKETFITAPSTELHHMEDDQEGESDHRTPARLDAANDPQLLHTNGKLPMWFRKLQGQGDNFSVIQSEAEPRQVRSRWREQLNPLTICSNFSPSPTKSREEEDEQREEEGDFHPQSLESLLGEGENEEEEEKEVLQIAGEDRSNILYPQTNTVVDRDFDVEAVADPQQSITQPVVRSHGVGPVWSTQLSPDSACSEGSAGSLEQHHDADTDSLSQGSSVGSLGLEDDDRNSLKNHFDTLASSLHEERFDTDLRTLQLPEEKHFPNPRLSISTRFLSRFQDKIRTWPSRMPPVSIPTKISEENNFSNTLANLDSSKDIGSTVSAQRANSSGGETSVNRKCADVLSGPCVERNRVRCSSKSLLHRRISCIMSHQPIHRPKRSRHTVVLVQCKDTMGDATSSTQTAHNTSSMSAFQWVPQLGYLGTTASSRAKVILEPPSSSTSTQDANKENLSSEPLTPAPLSPDGLDLHSTNSGSHKDGISSVVLSDQTPQLLDTPTEAMPQGGVEGGRISSVKETPTNLNQTLIFSPTPFITPNICSIFTSDRTSATASELTTCSIRQGDSPGQTKTRIQIDAEPGDEEELVTLQDCQHAASELREMARRAIHLYQQLGTKSSVAERRLQMSVLQDAFDFVYTELQAVLQGDGQGNTAFSGQLMDKRTTSLLEKYSELLVQMTQKKMNLI
ncbi:WD repeat-containing protein 62 isoform X2 [Echeneis naucrates]|uniref:WD repeat-containing protein 62 isoform X2 n=1 Tax=Echeneis naucrates TaxID=173247 RepID=UPI0011135016|nr:mitogen-activated protein kinase-binding protein 1-like isoform X2 [Echeneis naucrates]